VPLHEETSVLNKAPCHEDVFLTLAPNGGEWSASHPGCFTPRKSLQYPLARKLGISLDAMAKRKKIPSLPLPGIEPWSSSP